VPERWSVRLSVLGAILSVPALASLLVPAIRAADFRCIVSFGIYGAGLLGMFVMSAVYHSRARSERKLLKNLDYCGISLMVAGSFTPFCLLAVRTVFGYCLLGLVWAAAVFSAQYWSGVME